MKLTELKCKKAVPKEKEYKLHDGGGLYFRVKPNGTKLWFLEMWLNKHRIKLSIGTYPEIGLADARDASLRLRLKASNGEDPRSETRNKKSRREGLVQKIVAENTGAVDGQALDSEVIYAEDLTHDSPFRSLAIAWYHHWKEGKAPGHVLRTRNRLAMDVLPSIGIMALSEIKPMHVMRVAKGIERRIGHGTDLANRAITMIDQIMRYGVVHGVAEGNPAAGLKPSEFLKRQEIKGWARVTLAELPELLMRMDQYDGRKAVKIAMQLINHIFIRTQELLNATWDEIDLSSRMWTVNRFRMKMKVTHMIPISRQVEAMLLDLRKMSDGSRYLFPGDFSKSGTIHKNSILEALYALGYKGLQTGHGFRHIASTILHERGYRHEHIEMQLSHMQRDKVSAAYNYAEYLQDRTRMMQEWSDFLDQKLREGYEAHQP